MQCPHCGYMMLPVDKDCARCRQRGFTPSPNAAPPMPGVPYTPANMPPPVPPANTPPVWSAAPPPLNGPYTPPASYPQPPPPNGPYASPPYMPSAPVPSRSSNESSTTAQVIGGILGVLLLVGVIGLRIYLAESRAARRDAAFLEMNQHYNETMRPQFDNMRNMEQQAQQHAIEVGPPRQVIVNQPPIIINTQSGISPAQVSLMQAQQDLQMQRMQSQQNMQMQSMQMQQNMQNMHNQNIMQMQNMHNRMMQNRPGFGRGF